MQEIKLHGSVVSRATLRVMACLYEKDLHFQFVPIEMISNRFGKKQAYLSLSPFGDVPVLEDHDRKIFESRAITRYLAHEYGDSGTELIFSDTVKLPGGGSDLVYPESKKMAALDVWMEVEAHEYDPVAAKLSWKLVKRAFGMTNDTGVVEKYEEQLSHVLDVYEVQLGKSKYIAGDSFTLADLHHLPTMQYLMGTQAKKIFCSRPHVNAWCVDILARPAWLKTVEMQKKTYFG